MPAGKVQNEGKRQNCSALFPTVQSMLQVVKIFRNESGLVENVLEIWAEYNRTPKRPASDRLFWNLEEDCLLSQYVIKWAEWLARRELQIILSRHTPINKWRIMCRRFNGKENGRTHLWCHTAHLFRICGRPFSQRQLVSKVAIVDGVEVDEEDEKKRGVYVCSGTTYL